MWTKLHWVSGPWPGRLAVATRPRGGDWLEDEIASWRQAGIDTVFSLLTPEEERDLDLADEGHQVRAHGMKFESFMKRIAVLGSTGSIGRSTLSVVGSYPDRFKVVSLAAGKNVEAALEQAKRWRPRVVSLSSERDADQLRNQLKAAALGQIDV